MRRLFEVNHRSDHAQACPPTKVSWTAAKARLPCGGLDSGTPPMNCTTRIIAVAVVALLPALRVVGQVPDQLKHTILSPPGAMQAAAQFGYSVAVDGDYVVVGAPSDDLVNHDSGTARVFSATTGALLFVLPNPTHYPSDAFGWSVAISGTRVVVGAY